MRIRTETGATIIAVKRSDQMIPSPDIKFTFRPGDILYLIGTKENLTKALALLES